MFGKIGTPTIFAGRPIIFRIDGPPRGGVEDRYASRGRDRGSGQAGWIEIKRSRAASLPKPGTPQREELLALITQAELWPKVAYPNAARLLKAVDAGRFTPQQAGQVARLCPTQTICRLAVHPNG